jgi:hypothetical protein
LPAANTLAYFVPFVTTKRERFIRQTTRETKTCTKWRDSFMAIRTANFFASIKCTHSLQQRSLFLSLSLFLSPLFLLSLLHAHLLSLSLFHASLLSSSSLSLPVSSPSRHLLLLSHPFSVFLTLCLSFPLSSSFFHASLLTLSPPPSQERDYYLKQALCKCRSRYNKHLYYCKC